MCRLHIRRLAGPTRLHKLLELRQPSSSSFLSNTSCDKQSNLQGDSLCLLPNTRHSYCKPPTRHTSLDTYLNVSKEISKAGPSTVLKPGGLMTPRIVMSSELVTSSDYLLPGPLRRFLLHCDEYEEWWDVRRKNKIFAIAAATS